MSPQQSRSTSQNVRDILTAVENMYECVNLSTPTSSTIINGKDTENGNSPLKSAECFNGTTEDQNVENHQHDDHLSEIVLSASCAENKNRFAGDDTVPECPPRRSKPKHHKVNGNFVNSSSTSSLSVVTGRANNNCSLTNSQNAGDAREHGTDENVANFKDTSSTARPSAMDLAAACGGGKRSMWAELREVVNSGVLGNNPYQLVNNLSPNI